METTPAHQRAAMETTPSLSIESFSHSWLVNNLKPSFESLDIRSSGSTSFDASDEASFIEMDPKLPPSRRFSKVTKDFSFDFRTPQPTSLTLADAGELISDGFLIPRVDKPSKLLDLEPYNYEPEYFCQKEMHSSSGRVCCVSLRRCRRLSRRIFEKFIRPLCQRLRGHRSGSRVASISSRRVYNEDHKNVVECYSPATSPRTSVALSVDNWRRSCDSESSIYEAVLHCKRTNCK